MGRAAAYPYIYPLRLAKVLDTGATGFIVSHVAHQLG
jgi:predicted aspartyl protease